MSYLDAISLNGPILEKSSRWLGSLPCKRAASLQQERSLMSGKALRTHKGPSAWQACVMDMERDPSDLDLCPPVSRGAVAELPGVHREHFISCNSAGGDGYVF